MERFIEPVFFFNSSIANLFKSTIFLFVFQFFNPSPFFNLSIFQSFNLSILLVFQFLFKVEREGDNLAACLLGSIGIHIALRGVWQEAVFMTLVETIC